MKFCGEMQMTAECAPAGNVLGWVGGHCRVGHAGRVPRCDPVPTAMPWVEMMVAHKGLKRFGDLFCPFDRSGKVDPVKLYILSCRFNLLTFCSWFGSVGWTKGTA